MANDARANLASLNDSDKTAAVSEIAAAFASREMATIDEVMELTTRLAQFFSVDTPVVAATSTAAILPDTSVITPALKVENAVSKDTVYCLCCGRGFTMLKRHLKAEHGLTEEQYRAQFGLPEDFPLVAPSYSERKAAYAREAGLGKYAREAAVQPAVRSAN